MKHLLLTTIAAVVVLGTAFADPIHDAAKNGNLAGVQAELDKGVNVIEKEDNYGRTPLHHASTNGHKKIVELLIAKGADVNAKILSGGIKGETPLDFAIIRNHTEFADLLRKHGGKTGDELKAEGK
jgi:ankyrin repeat protein